MAFWTEKTLEALTPAEWESLCDGCGRCCLHKLRDMDTDELIFTAVACRLLDAKSCRCTKYATRRQEVKDCVRLTPSMVREIDWLPPSCAYRLVAEGKPLFDWHPLVSGDPNSVHRAGVSVRGRVVPEEKAGDLMDYAVAWPHLPRRRAR